MRIEINDTTYYVKRQGNGPPLLLLHGFTGSHHTWDSLVELLRTDYEFITIDLPGHGQTKSKNCFTMESVCSDIDQVLAVLGIATVHILGYSMGGRTALSFAFLFPHRIRSVLLESASPGLATEEERWNRVKRDKQLAATIEQKGVEAFVNYWQELPMFATQKELPSNVQNQIRTERLSQSAEGLASSLRGMGTGAQPSWWQRLSELSCPVLFITGTLDNKFTEIANEMKKHCNKARHIQVKNSGHAIHVEHIDFFGKIVDDFVSQIESV
ncbi:2-succinyl-6-hydroxy-2,4-cyclohexadiene-1-carboxylate synthase [Pontibacillus litoralis]|uniref:Putative 2-succinyl-6-hydroxy-2,4-cyclohexadiene-1-carboxylate synthase n=1 Tax=Pontibacillus litoralis JSM 072002 TaxID=1385512 RepID=A0A0A5G6E7_9BACI|nr:2-succinyl-6-hydroxy-2,4-cyclohexadiene-1-carboxylate synthase [Pontibacillus litoralis]KGX86748.1 esterase [Pontibacillus litoralis JSM 072002]